MISTTFGANTAKMRRYSSSMPTPCTTWRMMSGRRTTPRVLTGELQSLCALVCLFVSTVLSTRLPTTRVQYSAAASVAASVRCRDVCVEYFLYGGLVKVLQKDERRRQHNEPQAAAESTGAQTSGSATV